MISYKLFPFRKIFCLTPLVFLGFIYIEAVNLFFFFDSNASDLAGDPASIKAEFIRNVFSYKNSFFNYSFYQSFLFPLLIVLVAYMYFFVKQRNLKYLVGKTGSYAHAIRHLKYQLGLGVVLVFLTVLACISLLGIVVGQTTIDNDLTVYFSSQSILQIFTRNVVAYIFYYALVKSLALFVGTVFTCYLVDYFHSFIKGGLAYLFIMWGLAPILYAFLPFYLVPMTSLMITSYGGLVGWQLFAPYSLFLLVFLYIKVNSNDEVD